MKVEVKKIVKNDINVVRQLVRLEEQSFGDGALNEWIMVPFIRHGCVIAIYADGQIVGGLQLFRDWKDKTKAYLVGISISPDYRGRGLGTKLLQGCFDILKSEGIKTVQLTVDPDNHVAIRVYKDKTGFVITGKRKDEYGKSKDRLVMQKYI